MKAMINEEDRATYKRDSNIFSALFVLMILAFIPLYVWLDTIGLILYAALVVVTLYYANRVEKHKKRFDTQTIREIEAFTEGVTLDEIEKAREAGKRPYQTVAVVTVSTAIAAIINLALAYWLL